MQQDLSPGIWPPDEAFYIEAMLFCTTAAFRAADDVHTALEYGAPRSPPTPQWQQSARVILDGVQTLAVQAAGLSRYLWPARTREPHLSRAARLRAGFGVADDSCLRNRELRNSLEHFDERLDEFCQAFVAGAILPTYVGPLGTEPEVLTHVFRAYYTDVGVFEVLGKRFEMTPILEEVGQLHDRLLECVQHGSRIPDPSTEQASGT